MLAGHAQLGIRRFRGGNGGEVLVGRGFFRASRLELPTCFRLARVRIGTEGFAGVVTFMLFVDPSVIFLMMWSRVYYRYIYYFRDQLSCTLAWIASAIKGIS